METTEYKIKLPTLPDGYELCGPCYASKDNLLFSWTAQKWIHAQQHDFGYLRHIIARRKQSLADWANGQRLFRALGEMREGFQADMSHFKGDQWEFGFCIGQSNWPLMKLGQPPANLTGKLRLEGGKWVDA